MKYIKKVAETPLDEEAKVVDSLRSGSDPYRNAPSINAVNEAIANVWASIYPVGSIYITLDTVDPAVRFGGTWEQLKQKFLIAADDDTANYGNGATGGAFSRSYTPSGSVGGHVLTTGELPNHSHSINVASLRTDSVTDSGGSGIEVDVVTSATAGQSGGAGSGAAHNHGFSGTQATINTTPPYLAVYMWKRIA